MAPDHVDRAVGGIDGEGRALVLVVGRVELLDREGLAAVDGGGEADLALELAVLVEAVEGRVADVDPIGADIGVGAAEDIDLDVGFVEEVAVGGVVARLDDRHPLIDDGVAAFIIVEVLVAGDDELALVAPVECHEDDVELAARTRSHHRIGGGLEAVDRSGLRRRRSVERPTGQKRAAPGEPAVIGAAHPDPRLGRSHRRQMEFGQGNPGRRHHDLSGDVDHGDHGLGLAEPDVIGDVHRPVVVEERDEVVGVAGGGGDGGLDLPLQVAVALELPVGIVVWKDDREHVDVLPGLLGHRQRLYQRKKRQYQNDCESHLQPPAPPEWSTCHLNLHMRGMITQ